MNKIHRTTWNAARGAWVAVSEIAKTHGRNNGSVSSSVSPLKTVLAIVLACFGLQTANAAVICSTAGNTTTCNGAGVTNDSVNETGGNPITVHNLIVNNADIVNFTSGPTYTGMAYKAGIGLAGNNTLPGITHTVLGDLTLTVNGGQVVDSSIGQISGLYTRSDSVNADVTVNSSTAINISSSGGPVYGMLVEHFAGQDGSANVVLNNGSNITVASTGTGPGAGVIVVDTGINGLATLKANGFVALNASGHQTNGYSVNASGTNGNVLVDFSTATVSSIVVDGQGVRGINAMSAVGDSVVKAKGSITVGNTVAGGTLAAVAGVFASSGGGSANKAEIAYDDATGIIHVARSGVNSSDTSDGLRIETTNGAAANIKVNNIDEIQMANAEHSAGISARANGTGDIDIQFLNGDISATGSVYNSDGIIALASGGNITVKADGNIFTDGSGVSEAIYTVASQGNVTVEASGNITTTGTGTGNQGIAANTSLAGTTAKITYNNAMGNISTAGTGSHAVHANGGSGNAEINVLAAQEIRTSGGSSYALYGHATGTGTVNITNSGNLSTVGANASAIRGESVNGDVTIANNGTLTTTGANADGINTSSVGGNIDITNAGAITTSGDYSRGIYATTTSGNIDITNDGDIAVSGAISNAAAGSGIHVNNASGNVTINASHNIGTNFSGDQDGDAIKIFAGTGQVNLTYDDADGILSTVNDYGDVIQITGNSASTASITAQILAAKEVNVGNSHAQGVYVGSGEGAVTVRNYADVMNIGTSTSTANNGIAVSRVGAGTITIDSTSDMNVYSLSGSPAILAQAQAGKVNITVSGAIQTIGGIGIAANNHGIHASATSGAIDIKLTSAGSISTVGNTSDGIRAETTNGAINITSAATIQTSGANGAGIYATNSAGGGIDILSAGKVTTADAHGIVGWAASGNVTIDASNDVTTGQATVTTHNHAIEAGTSATGTATVRHDNGTVKVSGTTAGGGNNIALVAWDRGSSATDVNGLIQVGPSAIIDATQGVGAIQMRISGTAQLDIAAGAQVHGGNDYYGGASHGYGINLHGNSPTAQHTLNNAGLIDAQSDQAIIGGLNGGSMLIDNHGTIVGNVNVGNNTRLTFNNWSPNSWDIRNFIDTDSDSVRDTKAVAVSTLGGVGSVFNNEANGVVRLLPVRGEQHVDTTNQWLHNGRVIHDITRPGVVQAQILHLERFENRGLIDLTGSGTYGDTLVISGGAVAGDNGGGVYVSEGGSLKVDAVLNKGDGETQADLLAVDNVKLGKAPTVIYVNKLGGQGALTPGDGIEVVDVRGTSDKNAFVLGNKVIAGPYEYMLYNGSRSYGAQSWYLRTSDASGKTIYRPEVGSYLGNQSAATGLFMHTLHDRLGEPQYTEAYKKEGKVPAFWARVVGNHTNSQAADGTFDQSNDSTLIHLGGDISQWSNGSNRLHLGLMGAYGQSETDTDVTYRTPHAQKRHSEGTVDGYSIGAYATWYQNDKMPTGLYLDSWIQHSWFDNEVKGTNAPKESYDSKLWTVSLEAGYAFIASESEKRQWIIEPQAQLAYNSYSADSHIDSFDMKVHGSDADGLATRLGARLYSRSKLGDNGIQPFVEANWWTGNSNNSLKFGGVKVHDDMPGNRFEVKVGAQGEFAKGWQLWGHVGGMWGSDSYNRYEGMVGIKHLF